MSISARSTLALVSLAMSGTLLLAGCAETSDSGSSTATASPRESTSQSEKPTPEPSPTLTASGTPVTIACDSLLTLQNVYDFNPNYSSDPSYAIPTEAKPLVDLKGVACGWINQTSRDTFSVAVAKPDAASLSAIQNESAAQSQVVPTYGTPPNVEGYFTTSGQTGIATAFSKGYWIVISSNSFFEPGDVAPLMESVLGNLP